MNMRNYKSTEMNKKQAKQDSRNRSKDSLTIIVRPYKCKGCVNLLSKNLDDLIEGLPVITMDFCRLHGEIDDERAKGTTCWDYASHWEVE